MAKKRGPCWYDSGHTLQDCHGTWSSATQFRWRLPFCVGKKWEGKSQESDPWVRDEFLVYFVPIDPWDSVDFYGFFQFHGIGKNIQINRPVDPVDPMGLDRTMSEQETITAFFLHFYRQAKKKQKKVPKNDSWCQVISKKVTLPLKRRFLFDNKKVPAMKFFWASLTGKLWLFLRNSRLLKSTTRAWQRT